MTAAFRLRRWIWPPPTPALVDAGRRGELAIARARLWLVAVLALVPAASLLRGDPSALIGVTMIIVVLLASAAAMAVAQRTEPAPWLGFATGAFDVTVVSVFHLLLFLAGDADMALHSRVTFALYLLALTATGLRYDGRICTVAGALAVGQWLALVAWADATGRAQTAQQTGRFYGDAHLPGQVEEVVVLLLASALAGIIVSRARALRLSSIHDGLTRLLNRAYLEERLGEELARARRYDRPLAVAMVDIDHFKRVNDTWGHQVGDDVLRAVAAQLKAGLRRSDIVARYGGEEFVLVLPETPAAEAFAKLDALRRAVARTVVAAGRAETVAVTVSIGIATHPVDGATSLALIEAADRRLLAAKAAGRDRVHLGKEERQPALA